MKGSLDDIMLSGMLMISGAEVEVRLGGVHQG